MDPYNVAAVVELWLVLIILVSGFLYPLGIIVHRHKHKRGADSELWAKMLSFLVLSIAWGGFVWVIHNNYDLYG
jgi:hypothetical protein